MNSMKELEYRIDFLKDLGDNRTEREDQELDYLLQQLADIVFTAGA